MAKRGRSAPKSSRPTKRAKTVTVVPVNTLFPTGRQQQMFIPRSMGNPRAITERKYFTTGKTVGAISVVTSGAGWTGTEADPAANALFTPVTGDDFLNRDGRKVQVLSIRMKGVIKVPPASNVLVGQEAPTIRYLLYMDKQSNGAQSQGEDVIQPFTGVQNALQAPMNPANFGRFKILKDRTISLPTGVVSYDGTNIERFGVSRPFKINHKFRRPVVVHFNATNGGTIADIVDNSFHFIIGADDVTLAPTVSYTVRTTFIDM